MIFTASTISGRRQPTRAVVKNPFDTGLDIQLEGQEQWVVWVQPNTVPHHAVVNNAFVKRNVYVGWTVKGIVVDEDGMILLQTEHEGHHANVLVEHTPNTQPDTIRRAFATHLIREAARA